MIFVLDWNLKWLIHYFRKNGACFGVSEVGVISKFEKRMELGQEAEECTRAGKRPRLIPFSCH